MRKRYGAVGASLAVLVLVLGAQAQSAPVSFLAAMDADHEVPLCPAASMSGASGQAVLDVTDATAGTVHYRLTVSNLPDAPNAAHVHQGAPGIAGPFVQPLTLMPGVSSGVIGDGTFTNPSLVALLQADPTAYYVNVHTVLCGSGAIRGQLTSRWHVYLPAVLRNGDLNPGS
ncbi:MAG TPA: CHRD domain-containing protein [Chloroflexota bacterium]|jgi:hypothetical protein